MMKKLLTIFILALFSISLFAESNSGESSSKTSFNSYVKSAKSVVKNVDCKDCETKNCHDDDDHCGHHCSGLHNVVTANSQSSIIIITRKFLKTYFSFNQFYQKPLLDPALKPPTHS